MAKKHSKKMNKRQEPAPEPEPEPPLWQDDQMADNLSIPDLTEYPQRRESPYKTAPITLKVEDEYYTLLQYYLRPYARLECNPSDIYRGPNTYNEWSGYVQGQLYHLELTIGPRAAHTFIHYLSTGQYETLSSPCPPIETAAEASNILRARDIEEFARAIHTYAAAVRYEVPGLQELAKDFLVRFAERLPTEEILKVTREVYDSLGEEELTRAWLEEFVRGRLEFAFLDEEVSLRQIFRKYGIGKQESFDRFIVDETLVLFETARDEASQFLAGLGEPQEVTEPDLLAESVPAPEPEPVPEAELEVEPELQSEPEPPEVEVEDEPAPEPAPEPEILSELEPEPLIESGIAPEIEPPSWEDHPTLQPVQEPEPEAPVAMPPLEDSDWSAWGMPSRSKTKRKNKKAQDWQEPVEETLQPVAEPVPEVVADEHIF